MTSKQVKNKQLNKQDEDDTGSSGQGGRVEFTDFITGRNQLREDQLPPNELRRLLAAHDQAHKGRVEKQKVLRDQRNDLKNGKVTLDNYRQGLASGMSSQYPAHPILSSKAQFSGVDRQNNPVPTENQAQTNDENRNELENQYRLRHAPEIGKKFNPRPQFP